MVHAKTSYRWMAQAFGFVIAITISYLLLSTALIHLSNPYQFLSSILKYDLVPFWLAELAAMVLPFLHITIGIFLIVGNDQKSAFRMASALFAIYSFAQLTALARGLKVDCGCFGPSSNLIDLKSVLLAVGSSLACLFGSILPPTHGLSLRPERMDGDVVDQPPAPEASSRIARP